MSVEFGSSHYQASLPSLDMPDYFISSSVKFAAQARPFDLVARVVATRALSNSFCLFLATAKAR